MAGTIEVPPNVDRFLRNAALPRRGSLFRCTASAGRILAALKCGAHRPVRIATFNVNRINGRLHSLLAWLKEAAPDIVCLQELKAPDEKFPEGAIRAAGYGAIWHGQKS